MFRSYELVGNIVFLEMTERSEKPVGYDIDYITNNIYVFSSQYVYKSNYGII